MYGRTNGQCENNIQTIYPTPCAVVCRGGVGIMITASTDLTFVNNRMWEF